MHIMYLFVIEISYTVAKTSTSCSHNSLILRVHLPTIILPSIFIQLTPQLIPYPLNHATFSSVSTRIFPPRKCAKPPTAQLPIFIPRDLRELSKFEICAETLSTYRYPPQQSTQFVARTRAHIYFRCIGENQAPGGEVLFSSVAQSR